MSSTMLDQQELAKCLHAILLGTGTHARKAAAKMLPHAFSRHLSWGHHNTVMTKVVDDCVEVWRIESTPQKRGGALPDGEPEKVGSFGDANHYRSWEAAARAAEEEHERLRPIPINREA